MNTVRCLVVNKNVSNWRNMCIGLLEAFKNGKLVSVTLTIFNEEKMKSEAYIAMATASPNWVVAEYDGRFLGSVREENSKVKIGEHQIADVCHAEDVHGALESMEDGPTTEVYLIGYVELELPGYKALIFSNEKPDSDQLMIWDVGSGKFIEEEGEKDSPEEAKAKGGRKLEDRKIREHTKEAAKSQWKATKEGLKGARDVVRLTVPAGKKTRNGTGKVLNGIGIAFNWAGKRLDRSKKNDNA